MQPTLKRKLTAGERLKKLGQGIIQNRWLYVLILPALVYLIIFNYLPMYGIQIAFKDYKAVRGIAGSPWTGMNGFKHFYTFFNAYYFGRLISNTLLLNVLGLIFTFPMPIALDDEGKVYSPLTAEGLRPALETISRWYNEGLIDVEAVSQDSNAAEAKINAGNVGVTWRWRMSAMGTDEAIYTQYTCVIPFSADGYQARLQRYLEIPSFGAAITAGCKDVEAAAKWLDTQFAWENMISGYNGAKGEFWFYNDDNMVELVPMSDGARTVPGQSSMMYCSGNEYFSKVVMASYRIEKTEYCKAYEEAGVIEKNSWNILSRLISLTVDESTERDLLFAEIHKYANESLSNFIVKGVTDDGWNTYMNTLNSLRLNDYMNLYQTAYDRYVEANQ